MVVSEVKRHVFESSPAAFADLPQLLLAAVGKEHNKLLSAIASDEIAISHRVQQPTRDLSQDTVSD